MTDPKIHLPFLLGNVCDTGDGFTGICGIWHILGHLSTYARICLYMIFDSVSFFRFDFASQMEIQSDNPTCASVTSWLSPDGETPGETPDSIKIFQVLIPPCCLYKKIM